MLCLILFRFVFRIRTEHPAPPSTGMRVLDRLGWGSHRMLYTAGLGMAGRGPLMGRATDLPGILFGGGTLPADFWVYPIRSVHYLISRVLMAVIVLHIVGALYHTLM